MKISDTILKHHLRNVLWIGGGACGGKTTVSNLLTEKYGFLAYHCDDKSPEHHQLANSTDHPAMLQEFKGWEWFFSRSEEEYVHWLHTTATESMEMVVADLIHLSQQQTVIVEGIFNTHILLEIASPAQIAFLHADAAMVRAQYFERDHTRELLQIIQTLSHPEEALSNALNAVVRASEDNLSSARECGFTCFIRDSQTPLEETVMHLETHFGLSQSTENKSELG